MPVDEISKEQRNDTKIKEDKQAKLAKYQNADSYQCPLCPGHVDVDGVTWSTLLNDVICVACKYEIHNGFINWEEQPQPEQYNHAETIQTIIEITGRNFHHLKYQYLREKIVEWGGTVHESCIAELKRDIPETWLRSTNKMLDAEFKIIYNKNMEESK